jgi:hypothetical protein
VLVYSSFTGAKAGMALFHLSNRANWEINCDRTFWHAMDMKFSYFLKAPIKSEIYVLELVVFPYTKITGAQGREISTWYYI